VKKKKIKLKNVIVTRVMCAEMLGNSDVRATYTQSSYRNILGRVVQTLGPWVLVIHTFSPSLAGERLTDFNICNVKQTISFVKVRVLEYL